MTKASDNVFPRFLISEGGSTSTPASGQVTVYAKVDGLLYSKDDAGAETALGGGGGGIDISSIDYSTLGSDATINSTTWGAVNSATDLVVAAVAGDTIEVAVAARTTCAGTNQLYQDVYSIVSASPVNSIGLTGAASTGTSGVGVLPWVSDFQAGANVVGGSVFYVIQGGDLSGGNITIRWYARRTSASTVISGGSRIHCKNWGQ